MPKLFLLLLLSIAGCGVGGGLPPLTSAHPASPEAAEAPLPAMSQTLAIPERDAPVPQQGNAAPADDMPSGHVGH